MTATLNQSIAVQSLQSSVKFMAVLPTAMVRKVDNHGIDR